MSTNSPKPSLDDAYARVARAKDHITALQGEIAAILPPDRTITAAVAGPAFLPGGTQHIHVPPIVSILIGETLYNLRAALDYLVFELAYLDTGKMQSGTKFLIEDRESGWDEHLGASVAPSGKRRQTRKLWLPKLTPSHQAALKGLQPCFGCKWTKTLRDLSNPDKHRRLIAVVGSVNHPGHGAIGAIGVVMVTFKLTTKVAFEDGALVVETLELLQKQVTDVIQAFQPDF